MEELFILFIPRLLFFQGAKLSLIALLAPKTTKKKKITSGDVRCRGSNGVCLCGRAPPLYLYILEVGLVGDKLGNHAQPPLHGIRFGGAKRS